VTLRRKLSGFTVTVEDYLTTGGDGGIMRESSRRISIWPRFIIIKLKIKKTQNSFKKLTQNKKNHKTALKLTQNKTKMLACFFYLFFIF
tara:strand:- start:537 stop:803 length:267 start_codon:yes stop_codon:yes gene_type:complete